MFLFAQIKQNKDHVKCIQCKLNLLKIGYKICTCQIMFQQVVILCHILHFMSKSTPDL